MTSETAEETKPAPRRHGKPLSPKQWAEVEALWESGSVTYRDLVAKFGKSVPTFERHFKKHGIVKGSKVHETKKRVADAVAREEFNDATVLAARIRETKEEHYKMAAALGRLTWAEVLTAKQEGRAMSTVLNNIKALDCAMAVLKKAREERFAVLGLDRTDSVDPDAIPELVISELTPEQVAALRARDHTEAEEAPVTTNPDIQAETGPSDDLPDESE